MPGAQLRRPQWERTGTGGSTPSRNGNKASDRVFPRGAHLALPWQPRQERLRGWFQDQEPGPKMWEGRSSPMGGAWPDQKQDEN